MKRKLKRLFYTNKVKLIIYLITIILFISTYFLCMLALLKLDGIETLIRIIILFIMTIYGIYYTYKGYSYIMSKHKVKYYLLSSLTLVISILFVGVTYFINTLYGEIGNMSNNSTTYYTGYLIALNDTDNANIRTSGIIDNNEDIEGNIISKEIINDHKLDYEINDYTSYENMLDDLLTKRIDSMFVPSDYLNYFNDLGYNDIEDKTKIVYKKTTEYVDKVESTNDKTLDKPFTVLLMGVDSTSDNIEQLDSFNGDTLMLITFNPKTLNATIFSIPRDLYVPISCRNNSKARINSSSVGGVSCVMDTIKELMGIDIDYYAKINFKGVVDLVEALNGIDVLVTYPFCEQDSNRDFSNQICLKEGYQHLNGEQTLAYARHRHSLPTGDLQRIQNQQLIVEALTKRLVSLNTVTDFKDILAAISKNISTNLTRSQILSSYNILKDMVLNLISSKDALVIQKAYLEVYDNQVYNEKSGTYAQVLGYYQNSLDDIIKMMKINLEQESVEKITDFNFDANNPYTQKVAGKGLKTNTNNDEVKMPNFIGRSASEVEEFAKMYNISINKEFVSYGDSHYNNNYGVGIVSDQSISPNTLLNNISSITIYINSII